MTGERRQEGILIPVDYIIGQALRRNAKNQVAPDFADKSFDNADLFS